MVVAYCFPLLCSDRCLPDGDHGNGQLSSPSVRAGIQQTVIMAVPYCFPLLCAGRCLPDGDHGDERAVPLFSFCVRAGIYLRVIMAMSGTTMSDTFVFLLCSGRCLPDGDHGDVRAVSAFSFRFRAGIYLRVIMAMSGTAMSRTSVFEQVFTGL